MKPFSGISRLSALVAVGVGSIVTVAAAAAFMACGQPGTPGDEPTSVAQSAAPASTSEPSSATSLPNHPLIIDTQRARIFNDQVAADRRAEYEVARQWNAQQAKFRPMLADGGVATPNFTITTTTPVVGSAAVYIANFSSPSSSDVMLFGTTGTSGGISGGVVGTCTGCTSNNFFALNNIHNTATGPNIAWSATVSGGTSASPALSSTGTQVYVLSDNGTLYCFQSTTGATCSGDGGTWSSPTISIASGGAVTPWVDSELNIVYVNDGNGNLYRFNATTGAQQWKYNYSSSGSSSLPVESSLVIYIGDGAGKLYRILDPYTGSAPTSSSSITLSSVNGNCNGTTAIDGSVAIDTKESLVFMPYEGCGMSFPHYCPTCAVTSGSWTTAKASAWTGSIPNNPFHSWPTIDGTYVYWVIADKPTDYTQVSAVWKSSYALTGTVAGTPLHNASSSLAGATITSAPLVYNGNLFIGDQSGYIEEFGCASSKSASTQFLAETNQQGGKVNTPVVLDSSTGNILYGFSNGSGGGGVAQFPLWNSSPASNFDWNCPSGYTACDNQNCGTGTTSTQCVPTAECNGSTTACTVADAGSIYVGVAASEGNSVTGTTGSSGTSICPTGQVIQGIVGASFGTPPSSPDDPVSGNTFDFSSSCYATDSLEITEENCPLNTEQTCSFVSNDSTFGDPCVGTGKHYYGWFVCGSAVPDGGTTPTYCSRQNITPPTGQTDPCSASTDGGLAYCSGTCLTGWGDCNNNKQYDGCETYVNGTDPTNCGFCGSVCSAPNNGTASCSGGVCGSACNSGYTLCSTGTGVTNECYAGSTCPTNCAAILAAYPSATSGTYTVTVSGTNRTVYCDMTDLGGGWTQVLDDNTASGATQTSSYWAGANGTANGGAYSILNLLSSIHTGTSYTFLLQYPALGGYETWTQTSNPTSLTAPPSSITGLTESPTGQTDQACGSGSTFAGLYKSSVGDSYLSGDSNSSCPWWAVGEEKTVGSGIPAYNSSGSNLTTTHVTLYVQ